MGNVNDDISGLSCSRGICCRYSDKANEVDNLTNERFNRKIMPSPIANGHEDRPKGSSINADDRIRKMTFGGNDMKGSASDLELKYDESKAPGVILPKHSMPTITNAQVEKISKDLGKFNKDQKEFKCFSRNLLQYTIRFCDDSFYSGEYNCAWEREGYGVFYYPDGSKYEGFFSEDLFNGRGRLIKADSSYFEGNFIKGKANGFGTYHDLNGHIYIGSFVDEMKEGAGEEVSPKGSRYEGNYERNVRKGKGTLYLHNGSKYEGDFDNNQMNGFGVLKWKDGRMYSGQWVNDQMEGFGYYQWTDSRAYVGHYKSDKKHGFGIFIWPSIRIYEGFWEEGVQHGFGRIIRLNTDKEEKKVEVGKYENGVRIKRLSIRSDITRIKAKIDEEKSSLLQIAQDYSLKIKDLHKPSY